MTEQRHAIAVDAGGTSTRAVVVDAEGNALSQVQGGAGNPRSVGADEAARVIAATCLAAATDVGSSPQAVVVTAAGLHSMGGRFPELETALAQAGLTGTLRLESDLLSAYFSATAEPTGTVLIAGTGTTAARIVRGAVTEIRDGLGWLLGDEGSGFWIGSRVARAVAAHLDRRGEPTSLTDGVLAVAGNAASTTAGRDPRLSGLIEWVYSLAPVSLAGLARLASQEADRGDAVALRICDEAAESILSTLRSLPGHADGPTVVGGSVLGPNSPVGRAVLAEAPGALPVADGVVGASLLAVGALGGDTGSVTHEHIRASVAALRG